MFFCIHSKKGTLLTVQCTMGFSMQNKYIAGSIFNLKESVTE